MDEVRMFTDEEEEQLVMAILRGAGRDGISEENLAELFGIVYDWAFDIRVRAVSLNLILSGKVCVMGKAPNGSFTVGLTEDLKGKREVRS